MIQQKRVYPESQVSPSQYCRYFFRAEQSSGEIDNLVSGGDDFIKNTGYLDAALWANAGYATVGGGAANYCTLEPATHDLTLDGYSLIVTARVLKSAGTYPAAEQYFAASYNPGSNTGGIILACRTDGSARMYANAVDGSAVSVTSSTNVLCNGSAATEKSLVFCFPRETGVSAEVAVDGVLQNSAAATAIAGKSLSGARAMRLGLNLAGGAVDGYKIAAFAAYQVPVDMGNLRKQQIYEWAWRNPAAPIPDWVFE